MKLFKMKKMNILVLGADGMLGHDVYEHFKRLSSMKYTDIGIVTGLTLADRIDFTQRHALGNFMMDKIHYDWCINCIAYTDTQKAEHDEQGKLMSYKLNALAPKYIAESCNYWKTKLIHISTDYVFSEYAKLDMPVLYKDNTKQNMYDIDDAAFPKNNYGMHKLIGEKGIAESFQHKKNYAILRTSWLFGAYNRKSFIHKFIKNVGRICKEAADKTDMKVDVTSNEFSIPVSTNFIVYCINDVIMNKRYGIMHAVPYVNYGEIPPSRYDFAEEILSYFNNDSLFGHKLSDVKLNKTILPLDSIQPRYSSMKTSFIQSKCWQWYLKIFMLDYKHDILNYALKENEK